MKHFDNIINNMIKAHKDPKTQYSPTQMFVSKNELSFAISRLLDAQEIFAGETLDNKELTSDLRTTWFSIRDEMPSQTANDIALCIIENTPLSNTQEQTNEVQHLFYKAMHTYTDNTELSNAFTEIFFGQVQSEKFNMRAF
ncbi:MAG: hypothetical protein ABFR02_02095 [Campylobacterota bacterium]